MEEDFYWSSFSQGIAIENTDEKNTFGYEGGASVYSIFDTGSSGVLLTSDYFELVVTKLF